jgi:hypothetical protein
MNRFLRNYLRLFTVKGPLDVRELMRLVLIAIASFFIFALAGAIVTGAVFFVLKLGIGRLLDPLWLLVTMMVAAVPLTLVAVGSFIGILGCAIIRFVNTLLTRRWSWA